MSAQTKEADRNGPSRRMLFLAGFGAMIVGPDNVAAEISPMEKVDLAAVDLADAMRAVHGGTWKIYIDHDYGMVAVSRDRVS